MLVVLVPIAIFALIIGVILLLRPRSRSAITMPHESFRSVAGLDADEDAQVVDRLREALVARGAKVSATDHDYAVELDVQLGGDAFRLSVGFVGDDDAPWKIFVDGDPAPSRDAVELVHALLVAFAKSPTKVRWTTRALDASGTPEWQARPT